jgi:diphthamide synthase (EF-2-diphthine--ammonia ligase)
MSGAILWSGGKDSFLSLNLARERGFEVTYALSYVNQYSKRLLTSYIGQEVMKKQAYGLGLEFLPVYCSKRKNNLLRRLRDKLESLVDGGLRYLITGNTADFEFKLLIERLCLDINLRVIHPLWGYSPDVLISLLKGVRVVIVCSREAELVGRYLDEQTLSYIKSRGLSITGEGGLYQSFVLTDSSMRLLQKRHRRGFYTCLEVES